MRARSGAALAVAGLLCVGFALPVSAGSDPCYSGTVTFVIAGGAEFWIDDRDDGTWIYLENLQLSGYQPGGNIAGVVQDPCGNPMWADQLVAFVPA